MDSEGRNREDNRLYIIQKYLGDDLAAIVARENSNLIITFDSSISEKEKKRITGTVIRNYGEEGVAPG